MSDGNFILLPGPCPRGEILGHWGAQGVNYLFKHCHVACQFDGDDKQNRMQVTFSSLVKLVTLWQGQISLTCKFQRFLYQTLCVFSQIKDRNEIEQNFHSVARVMPWVGLEGAGGVNNLA